MDFFRLDQKDLQEYLFDMVELRETFYSQKNTFSTDFNLTKSRVGSYHLHTRREGAVYITDSKAFFNRNIIAKANGGIDNIMFYFIKNGNMLSDDPNGGAELLVESNSCNVLFMSEDYKSEGIYGKDTMQEATSLHLPVSYFEELVHRYPQMLEDSFLRYQKGESFYLMEKYQKMNPQLRYILSQLENSHLIGNSKEAYLDAKVLELVSILFAPSSQPLQCGNLHCRTSADYDKIHEAVHLLLSDIHNPPTIRELSLKVGINEKKLKYGFKEVYQNTVYGYLFEYKMQMARKLLLDTDKTTSEIAQLCGYDYASHFCTAFRRKFGTSPQMLRATV